MNPEKEQQLFKELREIKTALVGNREFGVDGLVQKFDEHVDTDEKFQEQCLSNQKTNAERINGMDKRNAKVFGFVAGLGIVIGVVIKWVFS